MEMHTPCRYPGGVVDVTVDVYGHMGNEVRLSMVEWLIVSIIEIPHPIFCHRLSIVCSANIMLWSIIVSWISVVVVAICSYRPFVQNTRDPERVRSSRWMCFCYARDHHNVESPVFQKVLWVMICISFWFPFPSTHAFWYWGERTMYPSFILSRRNSRCNCVNNLHCHWIVSLPWKSRSGPQPNLHCIFNGSITSLLTFIPVQLLSTMSVRVLQIEHLWQLCLISWGYFSESFLRYALQSKILVLNVFHPFSLSSRSLPQYFKQLPHFLTTQFNNVKPKNTHYQPHIKSHLSRCDFTIAWDPQMKTPENLTTVEVGSIGVYAILMHSWLFPRDDWWLENEVYNGRKDWEEDGKRARRPCTKWAHIW